MSEEIRLKVLSKIQSLKLGHEGDKLLAHRMEYELLGIKCFYCLDTQELWGYRGSAHMMFSQLINYDAKYYVSNCFKCKEHIFLRDTTTNELISANGCKIFFRDNVCYEERFLELKKMATKDIVVEEKPNFSQVTSKTIHFVKKVISEVECMTS
jgi:hypothetical protein